MSEDKKYSIAWCNKHPYRAWQRIQELEKELESARQEDIASCDRANEITSRLREKLAESVPKSEILNILANNVTSSDIADEIEALING